MMKNTLFLFVLFLISQLINSQEKTTDFTISFGSCNKQYVQNILWKEITKSKPDLFIWGGDIIYADTNNMDALQKSYNKQWHQKGYKEFAASTKILATWDDHDYGVNDAGTEYKMKKESQQLFLDFLKVPKNDIRRKQEGIYHSQIFTTAKGTIKVLILDTRYFRTALTKSTTKRRRYQANKYLEGTILGKQQWKWLQEELNSSTADFNIIVSSIQLLSYKHGWETWGNFPHEVDKFVKLIKTSKAKGVLVLSGDRHISEFSMLPVSGLPYPLIDFTSSGLTHAYNRFSGEYNPFRLGNVVHEISFGLLQFNFDEHKITMQMRGKDNTLQQEYIQIYN